MSTIVQMPSPGVPFWVRRDDALRQASVEAALPALEAALQHEAGGRAGQGESSDGLLAALISVLGVAWMLL